MSLVGNVIDLNGDGNLQGVEVFLTDVVFIAAVVGALFVIFRLLRGVNRFAKKANNFFDDWYGSADPGEGIKPGVLSRLHSLEGTRQENLAMLKDISESLRTLKEQIQAELDQGSTTRAAAEEAMRIAKQIQQAQEEAARSEARWYAKYLHDQNKMRREWTSILEVVHKMIGKTPEEQLELWDGVIDSYNGNTLLLNQSPEGEPK